MNKKAKARKATKHAKATRTTKPIETPASVTAAAAKAMKNDGISVCEAIRKVAHAFPKVRRAAIERCFTQVHKLNVHTVRRQIQLGREA